MKLKLSIRNTIILFNALLICVTGGTIILVYSSRSEASIYALSNNLMREISKAAVNKTATYLEPAERALQDLGQHFYHPGFKGFRENLPLEMDYLRTLLVANPEFRAIYFADDSGNLFMQRRMPDGSMTQRFVDRKAKGVQISWIHDNPSYYADYPNEFDSLDQGYDPRQRLWFQVAQRQKTIAWTEVYVFATDKMPGLSCVLPVFQKDGKLTGVCSVDIGILDLSFFLKNLATTPHAKSFLLDSRKRVLGLPLLPSDSVETLFQRKGDELDLRTVDQVGDPIYAEAYGKFLASGSPRAPFAFSLGSSRYFGSFASVSAERGLDLIFGLVLPDDDLTGAVKKNSWIAIGISLLMLVVAVFLSIFLSQAIANPMRMLIQEMDKVKDFVLETDWDADTIIQEIDTMNDSFSLMKQGLKNFRKYVPADLVQELIKMDKDATLGGERRELTMFFSDIANFTAISERVAPEELVASLCDYFAIISKTIVGAQGTLDKYIGDSVMAFWGAPLPLEDHAYRACRAALTIRADLQVLFLQWENQGKPRLNTRIGLHTDEVIVGNMGYESRMNYTVIGDGVNVASRMEGLNKFYGTEILISDSVYRQVKDRFECRQVDLVAVKGRTAAIPIYELVAVRDNISPGLKKLIQYYEKGLALYIDRNWSLAKKHFLQVLKYLPADGPSKTLLERCDRFSTVPPPPGWDGVNRFDEK